jgi:uncharacterized protein involved in outer membrane biogenesis
MTVFKKIPYAKPLAITLGVILAYALIGFVGVPRLIEHTVPDYVAEHLKRKATIGTVRFHPFIFKLDVRDFALTETDGTPIAAFRRLLVDFELSSLARWAWTFSRIGVEGLNVNVDIRPDGKLNLALLAESLQRDDAPAGGGAPGDESPPRLLLRDIALSDAAVTFSDRSIPTPASITVQPIDLELHDISTLPENDGPHRVHAQIPGGAALSWSGRNSLHPITSEGEIRVTGARPGLPWQFLRDATNLTEPKGTIDFSARYRFSYASQALEFVVEGFRFTAKGIGLQRPGDSGPMLSLHTIEASGGRFDLGARELNLPEIMVKGGNAVIDVDESGRLNWQGLVKTGKAVADAPPAAAPGGQPWKVRLDSVRVSEIALDYTDSSREIPLAVSTGSAQVGFVAQLEAADATTKITVSDLAIALSDVKLGEPGAKEALIALDEVSVAGGELNLAESRVGVKRAAVKGGQVRVTRDAKGRIRIVDVAAASKTAKARRELESALERAREAGHAWRIALDALDISGIRVALRDEGFGGAIAYDVEDVKAAVNNIESDGKTPIQFDAQLRVAQGGAARAKGEVGELGQRISTSVNVERLNLKPLDPLVSAFSATRLESGAFSAAAKIAYRAGKTHPDLQVTGALDVSNILLNDAGSGERLVAWKSLATKGISFALDPMKLEVREIRLVEPRAKVVVSKERSLNLATAFAPPAQTGGGDAAKVEPKPSADPVPSASRPAPAPRIAVESIVVEKGEVDFADLSLVLPFAAKVEELAGSVAGISSDPDSRALAKLEGKVGEYGLARVSGSVNVVQPKTFTDVTVIFQNVAMSPLSPYSVTFAGRKIDRGQLALDLGYKIKQSKLEGDNKVVLEQFTLGERVEAPGALDLPLDLAVALLTDSEGKIDVAVPVSGNVDDPKFSYGHLVWQAIGTLIKNIVTAPFRALGALFGGSGENLDSVAFEPGDSRLLPPEREKLKRITTALGKRPQLKLTVEGHYGEKDRAELRRRNVDAAVAAKLGQTASPGGTLPPVNPADAKTQRALEAVFTERNSAQALDQFATETGKQRGKPVDRVNALLAVVGKPSGDVAFYEVLLKRLVDTAQIGDEALRKVGDARAVAVREHLVKTLSVAPARVEQRSASSAGGETVKLSLDVLKKSAK